MSQQYRTNERQQESQQDQEAESIREGLLEALEMADGAFVVTAVEADDGSGADMTVGRFVTSDVDSPVGIISAIEKSVDEHGGSGVIGGNGSPDLEALLDALVGASADGGDDESDPVGGHEDVMFA